MEKRIRRVSAALPLVLLTGLLVGQTNFAFAHDPGRAGDDRATTGCAGCHSGGTAGTTVSFGGVPASVVAGSSNTITFTISGGPAVNAGLSVIASSGTLATSATDSTLATTGELIHTAAATMTGGSKVYTFSWTAPATAATVTLTGAGVSGNGNGSDTQDGAAKTTATINVTAATTTNQPPTARITGPTTAVVGAQVNFDGSTSTDPDGSIATYAWDFGDNTAGATATPPAHSYAAPGTYHVTLIVTDNLGLASATVTHDIVISAVGTHQAPVAKAGGPYTGTVGTAVTFSSAGSSVDSGLTATYSWDFGDASTSALANPLHIYTTANTFTVKLTVTDSATSPLSSTVTTSAVIAAATTPTTSTGQVLYDTNCASCHGPKAGPAGADGSVVGESAGDIREAIAEVPTMQSLNTLTPSEVYSIAIYLKPAGKVSRGEKLYNQYCAECHGPGGTGADEIAIVGASAALIRDEIKNEPEMQYLKPLLKKEDAIQLIARFLGGAGVSRSDLRALPDTTATDDTFLNSEPAPAAGALDWLSLIGVGAWGLRRRKK